MPKGSRVLMADDDKMLIDMYKERLELAGYMVTLCRNGEEALGKIREAKPDIILLDIMMPKVNGYEALASIKSDPATKDIPVIMLSALMRDFNREKAVEAGADDYLIKSEAMPADVITKIEQVLSKYNKSAVPSAGAMPSNIPAPSATPPPPPAMTPSSPLPDLPARNASSIADAGGPTEKVEPPTPPSIPPPPVEPPVPFVAPLSPASVTTASTPDTAVMQPDAPQNKIIFTPVNSESQSQIKAESKTESKEKPKVETTPESEAEKKSEVEPDKKPEKKEEVPVIRINPTAPAPALPWEQNQPAVSSDQPDEKKQSLASIALVVAIAMLLTTLVNDIAIYFFFFASK